MENYKTGEIAFLDNEMPVLSMCDQLNKCKIVTYKDKLFNPINSMIFDTFLNISLGGGGIQPDAVLGPETLTGGHPIRVSTEFR